MLHPEEVTAKDVERSLDRLKVFSAMKELQVAIPAFYYSAEMLIKYARQEGVERVNYEYFQEFNQQLLRFIKRDFSEMKQHEKEIISEVISMTGSEIFVECLKAEMRTERMHYLQEEEESVSHSSGSKKQIANPTKSALKMENQRYDLGKEESVKDKSEEVFDRLLTAYKEHNIDDAYELKELYLKNNFPLEDNQKDLFSTIDLEYKTMISFYEQFDMDGWIMDKEEKGVTLEYKLFEEEKQIAIRIQSQFNVKIENFLAILTEMDLFGNYVPFCYDSKELKVISRNEKIGTSKVYIPCLTDRETYFYAAGYDRYKKNGSVFCYSKTINEDTLYQEKYGYKVPEKSDLVRLEYKFFIVEYIPITKSRAKVRLASKVDMKLDFLPQFIINLSARKFAFDYFKNIIKVNKKFEGSEWDKKIKENPDFYSFFKKKIDEYIQDDQ